MKVFLDTNVVIDFYDKRGEFFYPATIIFDLAYKGTISLYVSAITFVNAFFILRKTYSRSELYESMKGLASLCIITEADKIIIERCLDGEYKDFEDRVQFESAVRHDVDVIVTRNIKDFERHIILIQTPKDFVEAFLKQNDHHTEDNN